MATLDMTEGVYRRIYAGFLKNKKINSVSWMAEAWFWRLVVLADDYGNIDGDMRWLTVNAAPKREVDTKQAKILTDELRSAGLIMFYQVDGEDFINIPGFIDRQPANKNGRRIKRVPRPEDGRGGESEGIRVNPGESKEMQTSPVQTPSGNPGESGGIRVNAGESSPSDSDSDSDSDTESDSPHTPRNAGGRVGTKKPPKLIPAYSTAFEAFWARYPTTRRTNKPGAWKIWERDQLERPQQPGQPRLLDLVMRSLEQHRNCEQWQDGFVPLPTTWLNQKRWSTDPPTRERSE